MPQQMLKLSDKEIITPQMINRHESLGKKKSQTDGENFHLALSDYRTTALFTYQTVTHLLKSQ